MQRVGPPGHPAGRVPWALTMCGLAGFILKTETRDADSMRRQAEAMAQSLRHRGPDGEGVWVDAAAGAALAHRRLSVIDLSEAGAQPMVSADGRWVIAYNGEVYNAPDLRRDLEAEGVGFRGRSDTEVLLEACARWGLSRTLDRLEGMFAFALWDQTDRRLHLVGDRLGIKPLYWSTEGQRILFGSELKALQAYSGWSASLDSAAAAAYLRYGYVPAPQTIYRSTWKLRPGEWISFGLDGTLQRRLYWDLRRLATEGLVAPLDLSDQEAEQRLDALIGESVLRRTLSDVPLGAFVSGGIDSSLVAAVLQDRRPETLSTFCIGFEESAFDESAHARRVAERLGTDHTEHRITAAEARQVVPKLAEMYDEPFGDSSQIPTHLVSVLARRHVTVVLSGDGGDELFAGYDRHRRAEAVWDRLQHLPRSMRRMAAVVARGLGPKLLGPAARVSGSRALQSASRRVRRAADLLAAEEGTALPLALISQWPDPHALVPGADEHRGLFFDQALCDQVPHLADRMRLLDAMAYLPGDLLTKVDRASMSVGLEVRVPLLDHRIAEFAFALPRRLLIREGHGKWILRRVLSRYLPGEWFERPKQGFAVPVGAWLRGPLRDWAESLLDEKTLSADGLLNPKPIRAAWAAHRRGEGGLDGPLWTVLMLQAWRARWGR